MYSLFELIFNYLWHPLKDDTLACENQTFATDLITVNYLDGAYLELYVLPVTGIITSFVIHEGQKPAYRRGFNVIFKFLITQSIKKFIMSGLTSAQHTYQLIRNKCILIQI